MQHAILTLIRHGETTGNLNRLLQGVTDSPLTVFGQAQVDALARTWATTIRASATDQQEAQSWPKEKVSKLDLPPPTLVVCSPIGRARKTAEAIHQACTSHSGSKAVVDEHTLADQAASRLSAAKTVRDADSVTLLVDPGLKEKDFGWKESTRGGTHVPGYPKGSGPGETRAAFLSRVHTVGLDWLRAASRLASESSNTVPHIVLVSHGMWISTFLSAHPPTTISQVSGQPGFLPFAANTGMFSLKVQSGQGESGKPVTDLFRANGIRHLEGVKRQKGGFGREAYDSKQRKLSSFFTKPPSSPVKGHDKASDVDEASLDGSPSKKRKI